MEKHIKVEVDKEALALTNVLLQHTKEEFGLLCVSGRSGKQYVMTPAHAKRIWLRLGEHIAAFEKAHGPLKAVLPKKSQDGSEEKQKVGF